MNFSHLQGVEKVVPVPPPPGRLCVRPSQFPESQKARESREKDQRDGLTRTGVPSIIIHDQANDTIIYTLTDHTEDTVR